MASHPRDLLRRRPFPLLSIRPNPRCYLLFLFNQSTGTRWFSSRTESTRAEFTSENAYEVLGVSETSSFAEIKASFHKLAKQTHPDLAESTNDSDASRRFVQILAAYEVKHMFWYELGEKVSVCECRCSRARLPPSKFWLFEPRCGMHDIGGWYIETFGRDKKGRMLPSQRYWDGFDAGKQFEQRLHPAMYLLALAYRTLDLEDAKRRKSAFRDVVDKRIFKILNWCKRLV